MIAGVPHIPETAPFSPAQREWLNGFLAGLFSDAATQPEAATEPVKVGVYFASQSGTAERLAKKLTKQLNSRGFSVQLSSLDKTQPAELAHMDNALFLVSTYGEGDPPDNAKLFRDALFAADTPKMPKLRYGVFCLGDRHYEHFCGFGIELDERLGVLGGIRLTSRIESDVDVDEPFTNWLELVMRRLAEKQQPALVAAVEVRDQKESAPKQGCEVPSRDNPYLAELRERKALTASGSSKLTMHLCLALNDAELKYEAGDACGVLTQNDPLLVGEILSLLPFGGDAMVELPKLGTIDVAHALLTQLQPTRLTRKILQFFAEKTQCKELLALLPAEQQTHLETFLHGRGLVDLLETYRGVIESPDELVQILPKLSPRLYSISSSPKTHKDEVHCTVAVVRYRSHNRERGGVASTMLESRVDVGDRVPIYIQPNKRFRIPADGNVPMIMIGPGTGIAPFRAFLHERRALGHRGYNWLFFGERSAKTDFLYEQELREMFASEHLTRLDTAFSRDQTNKVYVQDRMLEHGAEIWRWLQAGAQLFVCGDASRMAKDVDAALHRIVEKHGGTNTEAAREYVAQLHDDRRYHRDVY